MVRFYAANFRSDKCGKNQTVLWPGESATLYKVSSEEQQQAGAELIDQAETLSPA